MSLSITKLACTWLVMHTCIIRFLNNPKNQPICITKYMIMYKKANLAVRKQLNEGIQVDFHYGL